MNFEQCFEAYLALDLRKMCLCLVLHFIVLLPSLLPAAAVRHACLCLHREKKKKQNQATCRLHRGLTPSPKAFGDIQQNHSNLNSKNPKIQLFQRPPLFEFADIQKPQCHRLLVHYVLEPEKLDCCTPPLNAMFRQTLRSTNYFLQSLHLFC